MIDLVVARLKTGTLKSVIPFGMTQPPAPYLVVKEEPVPGSYTRYRIIGHWIPSAQQAMRLYMRKDVYNLLHDVFFTGLGADTRCGKLRSLSELTPLSAVSDDGTVSMERTFYYFDVFR
jgi:hypothetical protein